MYRKKQTKTERKVNVLNTPYLIIVESPSKCAKIEKYLGFQYHCIASQGHIRGMSKVCTSKQHYRPEFKLISDKQRHIDGMRDTIERFLPQNIYLATDDDREGEAIAWHICEVFDLSIETTKRILFHEITEKAIKHAVAHPSIIRMSIVYAQQARQTVDRMIGFQISPLLSKMLVHDSGKFLSAGRCQTPTLRLVYDNDQENKQKKSDEVHYNVSGSFFAHPSTTAFKLTHPLADAPACETFLEASKTHTHTLTVDPEKPKTTAPPLPFNTSHLLQTSSNVLHISPKQTMDYCQKLYQGGYITYMRTDSRKYAAPFIETIKAYLEEKHGEAYVGNVEKLTNTDNNNPHEAIRVTNLRVKEMTGDGRIGAVYKMIWKRTVESCMSPYQYLETGLSITAPTHLYKTAIEYPAFRGWKAATVEASEFAETQLKANGLLTYARAQQGKTVRYLKVECKAGIPERENHYTEASLIQKMESIGIGRPSTFSMLVGTIQERSYVDKTDIEGHAIECYEFRLEDKTVHKTQKLQRFGMEKNKLLIQTLGMRAIDKLMAHFAEVFSYDYTSQMESQLDQVAEGARTYEEVCSTCDTVLKKCTKTLKDKMKKTYPVDEEYEVVFGKTNAMLQHVNDDGTKYYKSINTKVELDFDKLEKQEYKLEDLLEESEESLGTYQGEELFLKKGPFGVYAQWGDNKGSLKGLFPKGKSTENATSAMIIQYLEASKSDKGVLRTLANNVFIKNGKYGHYIQYGGSGGPGSSKPKFVGLKKCKLDYLDCSAKEVFTWVKENHGVQLV
jgi:DNA topoisomerase-1